MNTILSVQITMLALTTNAWIHVVFLNLAENRLFVKPPHIVQFATAHLIGPVILTMSVISTNVKLMMIALIVKSAKTHGVLSRMQYCVLQSAL